MRSTESLNAASRPNTRDAGGKAASILRGLLGKLCCEGEQGFGEDQEDEDREDFASPGLCISLGIAGRGVMEAWEMGTE